jgi:hypothetical protein
MLTRNLKTMESKMKKETSTRLNVDQKCKPKQKNYTLTF